MTAGKAGNPVALPPDPCAEGPAPARLARPAGRQVRAAPRCRPPRPPLTALRGVAIGRVRLNVDVLHARNASAQDGAHGHSGPGWPGPSRTGAAAAASSRRHGREQAARTPAYGRGSLSLRAPTPDSAGPTLRQLSAPDPRHLGKWSPLASEGTGLRRGERAYQLHFPGCSSPGSSEVVDKRSGTNQMDQNPDRCNYHPLRELSFPLHSKHCTNVVAL